MMFVFDVETLGKKSDAIILSMALTPFDLSQKPSYQELLDATFFVKLDATYQRKQLKRTITPSSLEWWGKQCDMVKHKSFTPSPEDVTPEVGYEMMREFASKFPDYDSSIVWARGNLDQLVIDDLEESLAIKPIFNYNKWRDVRTAVDILYGSKNGYPKVNYPGFNKDAHVYKHDPVHDCAYDAMMLMYGESEE